MAIAAFQKNIDQQQYFFTNATIQSKERGEYYEWLEKSLVVAALVGWSMAFASGCATRSDEQRYAAANRYSYPPTYTYRYGQNRT